MKKLGDVSKGVAGVLLLAGLVVGLLLVLKGPAGEEPAVSPPAAQEGPTATAVAQSPLSTPKPLPTRTPTAAHDGPEPKPRFCTPLPDAEARMEELGQEWPRPTWLPERVKLCYIHRSQTVLGGSLRLDLEGEGRYYNSVYLSFLHYKPPQDVREFGQVEIDVAGRRVERTFSHGYNKFTWEEGGFWNQLAFLGPALDFEEVDPIIKSIVFPPLDTSATETPGPTPVPRITEIPADHQPIPNAEALLAEIGRKWPRPTWLPEKWELYEIREKWTPWGRRLSLLFYAREVDQERGFQVTTYLPKPRVGDDRLLGPDAQEKGGFWFWVGGAPGERAQIMQSVVFPLSDTDD